LKAPGNGLLKVQNDKLLSNVAMKFYSRRYHTVGVFDTADGSFRTVATTAGAYTRPLLSST
jgi:hypothetical protein